MIITFKIIQLSHVSQRLTSMARGTQRLLVVIVIRAALEQRHHMINLNRA